MSRTRRVIEAGLYQLLLLRLGFAQLLSAAAPLISAQGMIDPASFKNVRLRGGFVIASVEFTRAPMVDALGRQAVAQTRIVGGQFHLLIQAGLTDRELSISLYHEILEAATVASLHPPDSVLEFNEGDFEQAGSSNRPGKVRRGNAGEPKPHVAILRFS